MAKLAALLPLKSQANESGALDLPRERLAQMIEQMPINALICDPRSFKILYANPASVETLRKLEHLIPVKADRLVGTSVDVFHKKPAPARDHLRPAPLAVSRQDQVGR
jgi:methyl-accepting chemotaxis protein